MIKHENIYAALAAAQADADAVEKDARNAFHKYNYASAEAMIAESKRALSAHGLSVYPHEFRLAPADEAMGKLGAAAVLISHWFVAHATTVRGSEIGIESQWPVIPEKGRPLDKALAAARTASLGYLLRDLLQLPRVEEGTGLDDDRRDHEPRKASTEPTPVARVEPKVTTPHGWHMLHGHMGAFDRAATVQPELLEAWKLWQGTVRRHASEYADEQIAAMTVYKNRAKALLDGLKWEPTEAEAAAVELLRSSRSRSVMETDATEATEGVSE